MISTVRVLASLLTLSFLLTCTCMMQADELQQPEHGRKIKVFVLAGQSNMEGRADGNKLTPRDKQRLEKVQSRVQLAFNNEPIRKLNVVKPSKEIGEIYNREFIFGPELFFGIELAEAWPDENILLVKLAAGATSLHGCWNPEWQQDKAATMGEQHEPKLYGELIAYVKHVLSGYEEDQYEICAVLWVQGETDSGNKIASAEYGNNLRNLIKHIRHDMGCASMPFILFQVGHGKVVKGMKQVARELPNVILIPQGTEPDSQDFYQKMKNGHYNYDGMKKLGSRFADRFLKQPVQKHASFD